LGGGRGGVDVGGGAAAAASPAWAAPARDAYAALRLPRSMQLLPPPFVLKTKDEAVRTAFGKIWDGDFVATWVLLDHDAGHRGRLVITGGLPESAASDDDDDTLPADELRGPLIRVVLNYSTTTISGEQVICQERYPNFAATLKKEKVKAALCHRMLHHVVRTNGFRLPGGDRKLAAFEHACRALRILYTGGRAWQGLEKCYHSALDTAIIAADLSMGMEEIIVEQTMPCLRDVGELLEVVGNYAQAAKVYVYAVETFFTKLDGSGSCVDRPILYCNAGLAYKRDGQVVDAEECYIEALRSSIVFHGGEMDQLNHSDTTNIISNMLVLYDEQNKQMPSDQAGDDKTYYGFLAVLYAAGFRPPAETGRAHIFVMEIGSPLARFVLPYRKQDEAKMALALAILGETTATTTPPPPAAANTTNVEKSIRTRQRLHFRSSMAACMPTHIPFLINRNMETSVSVDMQSRQQAEAARQVVDVVCANPSCTNRRSSNAGDDASSFKSCPCR
jgi:tetratricopeptide (TPR) repeat protein